MTLRSLHLAVIGRDRSNNDTVPLCGRTPFGTARKSGRGAFYQEADPVILVPWANSMSRERGRLGRVLGSLSAAQGDGDGGAMGTKVWHPVATLSFPQCQNGMANVDFSKIFARIGGLESYF